MKGLTKESRRIVLSGDKEMINTFKNEVKEASQKKLDEISKKKEKTSKEKGIRNRKCKSYKQLIA